MTYDYIEKQNSPKALQKHTSATVCGISVQLVFAEKKNSEVPEIVGKILKGSYLQRQSV